VTLDADACAAIREAGEAQVDLAAQEVRWPGGSASFELDPGIKHRLLNGLDDIGLTLQQSDAIADYESARERSGPVTRDLA
jgi:3-isopropylmalate dehydratase small subunit